MPRGPKGEKRPADVIGNAVKIAKIATGEVSDTKIQKESDAATLGKKGGKARAAKLSPQKRSEIAKLAASRRWRGNGA